MLVNDSKRTIHKGKGCQKIKIIKIKRKGYSNKAKKKEMSSMRELSKISFITEKQYRN